MDFPLFREVAAPGGSTDTIHLDEDFARRVASDIPAADALKRTKGVSPSSVFISTDEV
jgi:hypothetical protein